MIPTAALAGRWLRCTTPRSSGRARCSGGPEGLRNGPAKGNPAYGAEVTGDHDDQVGPGGESVAVSAEVLAERPLDAIANNGGTSPPADDQTQAHPAPFGVCDVEGEGA